MFEVSSDQKPIDGARDIRTASLLPHSEKSANFYLLLTYLYDCKIDGTVENAVEVVVGLKVGDVVFLRGQLAVSVARRKIRERVVSRDLGSFDT